MRNDPLEKGAQGFADIVMNLLAILIVVTLIAALLISSRAVPTAFATLDPAERDRTFPLLRLTPVPAFSSTFLVTGGTVRAIDFDSLAVHMREGSLREGEVSLLGPDMAPVLYSLTLATGRAARDPGSYVFTFTFPDISEVQPPMPLDAALKSISEQGFQQGRPPNFLVMPSGFELFEKIERHLVENGSCFRWYPVRKNEIVYRRDARFFMFYSARRCPA